MDGGYGALTLVGAGDRYAYQDEIIVDLRRLFQGGYKGATVISPTGSGKSYVVAKLAARMAPGKLMLYLAPRKLLVSGVSEKLTEHGIAHSVRMSGVPWTGGRMPDIQAWCIQSYFNHLKQIKHEQERLGSEDVSMRPVSLFVIDEAHTHQPAIRKLRAMFPKSLFVFLTATPLPGMDKFCKPSAMVLGPSVPELQAKGILVPVRYKTYQSDGRDVEALRGEIVSTWMAQGEDRKTVVFCKNRLEAKHIHERFLLHGVPAEYMDCNTPQSERDAIRERIREGESKVVVNVEVMGYGVDWPFIDCVVLAYVVEAKLQDTATRLAEYIQKVGRGLRASPGKENLVLIDHTGTALMFLGVEEEREWTIESAEIKEAAEREVKKRKERKEPKLITCHECGHKFYQLSECPRCNAQVAHQDSDDVAHVDAQIAEVDLGTGRYKEKPQKVLQLWDAAKARRAYADILWCVRNKKKKDGSTYSDGMAKHIYDKLHTGHRAPWPRDVVVTEPNAAMKEWAMNAIKSHVSAFFVKQRYVNKKKVA